MSDLPQHYYQTAGHVIAAGVALSVLDVVAVGLRFAGRINQHLPIGIDDWLLLPATVLTVGVGICLVVGASKEAFGYREIPTSMENPSKEALAQMTMAIKLEWSISIILPIALACTKISFLFFYKRIFSISPAVKKLLWFTVGFVICWAMAFLLATLLCCKVMAVAIWKPVSEMAQCKFFLEILMGFCITGFVTDVFIIGIPIPLVCGLNLRTGPKLLACLSFLLGAVTVACALARLIVAVEFVQQAADPKSDNILNITLYIYWAMVEASMGVFAACLPTLQLVFRRWAGWEVLSSKTRSFFSSNNNKGSSNNYSQRDGDEYPINVQPVPVAPREKQSSVSVSGDRTASREEPRTSHTYHVQTMVNPTKAREAI